MSSTQVSLLFFFGTDNDSQNAVSPCKVPTTEYIKICLVSEGWLQCFPTSKTLSLSFFHHQHRQKMNVMTRCQSLGSGLGTPMDSLQQVYCCFKSFSIFSDQLMPGYLTLFFQKLLRKGGCTKLDAFSEILQTAFDLLLFFGQLYCNFFYNGHGCIYARRYEGQLV